MAVRLGGLLKPFYFAFWLVYFTYFWSYALTYDSAGNLVAGEVNIWGDWAAHLTMTTALAARGPWLTTSPLVIGQPFSYPFLTNLISAQLLRWLPLTLAMTLPSLILSLIFIWALYYFYRRLFASTGLALLASILFILNGGTGFTHFLQDLTASSQPLATINGRDHAIASLGQHETHGLENVGIVIDQQNNFGSHGGALSYNVLPMERKTSPGAKKASWQSWFSAISQPQRPSFFNLG